MNGESCIDADFELTKHEFGVQMRSTACPLVVVDELVDDLVREREDLLARPQVAECQTGVDPHLVDVDVHDEVIRRFGDRRQLLYPELDGDLDALAVLAF